ncbi:MAG: A/G-specific adenine glycosylase [Acholeplasmataceae bacterium]
MAFHQLIDWFHQNKRELPFRETSSPYEIWVSEIMLQQTQVATMLPYFKKFIHKYPNVLSLADAPLEEVLTYVTGIGYYRRFKLMHQAAKMIRDMYQGIFPTTYEDVRSLPGVGLYTAGAIMSIAYKKPYSALDGNVMRVLTRVYEISDDIRLGKTQKKLNQLNQSLIEQSTPDIYTHAMMELGATVCKPKNPMCESCPLRDICQSYSNQTMMKYPLKSSLGHKKEYQFFTLLLTKGEHIAIKKETSSLYEGMYLFPQFDLESISALENNVLSNMSYQIIDTYDQIKHVFTHQIWLMTPVHIEVKDDTMEDVIWVNRKDLSSYPMPKSHLKVYQFLK